MQVIHLWCGLAEPGTGLLKAKEVNKYLKTIDVAAATQRLKRKRLKEHQGQLKSECAAATEKAYAEGLRELASAAAELRAEKERVGDDLRNLLQASLETVFRKCSVPDLVDEVIAPVLANLQNFDNLTVIVPVDKAADFEKAFEGCKDTLFGGLHVTVEPSSNGASDECIVYSGTDVLDFSVSVITEMLMKTVMDAEKPVRATNRQDRSKSKVSSDA